MSIGLCSITSLPMFKSQLPLTSAPALWTWIHIKLNRFFLYCVETLWQKQEYNPVLLSSIHQLAQCHSSSSSCSPWLTHYPHSKFRNKWIRNSTAISFLSCIVLHDLHSSSGRTHSVHCSMAGEFMKGQLCNPITENEVLTHMNQIAELSGTGSLSFDVS